VHFLQGEMKIDGRRLAAVGMGPYRPVSRRNKAKNRRIEIVLFPQKVKLLKE
jgi:flagellar motor protein MotB